MKLLIGLLSVCLLASCGTYHVNPDSTGKYLGKGAVYYLPKTQIVATTSITKTAYTPGRFHFFCRLLLDRKPEFKTWQNFVADEKPVLSTVGIRDDSKRFVSMYPGFPNTFSMSYKWNAEGVLTHGEASVENKSVEMVVSTLEAGVKIAAAALKFALAPENKLSDEDIDDLKKLLDYLEHFDSKIKTELTPQQLALGIQWAKNPSLNVPPELYPNQPPEDLAKWKKWQEANGPAFQELVAAAAGAKEVKRQAAEIAAIEEKIKTMAADDPETAKKKVLRDELQAQYEKISATFFGSAKETTWTGEFRVVPEEKKTADNAELFQIIGGSVLTIKPSVVVGPGQKFLNPEFRQKETWQKALWAELPPDKLKNSEAPALLTVKVAWASTRPDTAPQWNAMLAKDAKAATTIFPSRRGWYYRVPAAAKVSVLVGGEPKTVSETFIAQHGCVAFLPKTAAGQKVVSNIDLDPNTGALLGLTYGGTAFDPGLINKVGAAGATYLEAEQAVVARREAANDPVKRLANKKAEIELKKLEESEKRGE